MQLLRHCEPRKVVVHKDSCQVRCSDHDCYIRYDDVRGYGCDLVYLNHRNRSIYLVECKTGVIGSKDITRAIDQLRNTLDELKGEFRGYRFFKFLVHCNPKRVFFGGSRELSKEQILLLKSFEDLSAKLQL